MVIASLHFVSTSSVEIVRDSVGTALAVYIGATGTNTSVVSFSEPLLVGTWKRVTVFVHKDEDAGASNDGIGAPHAQGPIGQFRANIDNVRVSTIE